MRTLARLATAARFTQFSEFPSGTHNETWRSPGYYEAVRGFVECVFGRATE
jgi:hypothetical protein